MLDSLHISNYALIAGIDLQLGPGLNIITGETGAGKSIMLGALSLLLGERADTRVVRDSSRKSVIEAVFTGAAAQWQPFFDENDDVDADAQQCVLRREITPAGRSRAFINDTPVTLDKLRALAMRLVDIHSQHQNLLLASPAYQLEIIDHVGQNHELLRRLHKAYGEYAAARRAYHEMAERIEHQRADADYMQYQLDQINELKLTPGMAATLEQEREVLANVTEIKGTLSGALDQIDAADHLSHAADALRRMADKLAGLDALAERLESAAIEVKDIYDTLVQTDDNLQADPEALEAIDERLADIYTLMRKHHVDDADQLIALAQRLRASLAEVENADEALAALKAQAQQAQKGAMAIAKELSERRQATAQQLAVELRQRALPLGMSNLQVDFQLERAKLSATGIDSANLLCAFNKNQPLMPISGAASGGEISRLMLCIKSLVAQYMQLPTIIFDEVDTGVSGDIAARMGQLMTQIAQRCQVVVITHLPAVAARGQRHFKVYKQDSETATNTHIVELTGEQRVAELALMLSGDATSPEAQATARALLNNRQ